MATHQQVAHAWAHQTGKQCNGHSLHYSGTTLYSYQTAIARIVPIEGNNPIVLFSERSYSDNGRWHLNYARQATRQFEHFELNSPTAAPSRTDFERYLARAKESVAKAKCARKYSASHLDDANKFIGRANRLNVLFKLEQPLLVLNDLDDAIAAMQARHEAERAERLKVEAAREARYYAEQKERRENWLAGLPNQFHGQDENGGALLRIKGDALETSLGADVPLDHAIKAFKFIATCRDKGEMWQRNGHTLHVGSFQIDRIEPNGDIHAGCHFIQWAEIARIAAQLELLTLS